MYTSRNLIVLATLILTSLDLFFHFVTISEGWFLAGRIAFLSLGVSLAMTGGALIAHAVLSLWDGTSFVKGLIDYEPGPIPYKLC